MLPLIDLIEYVDAVGRSPYGKWLEGLDGTTHGRVLLATLRMQMGNFSSVKGVGAGVYELRMDFGPGYRVYFGKQEQTVVILLGGGTKKRQQADIAAAQARWHEFKGTRKA